MVHNGWSQVVNHGCFGWNAGTQLAEFQPLNFQVCWGWSRGSPLTTVAPRNRWMKQPVSHGDIPTWHLQTGLTAIKPVELETPCISGMKEGWSHQWYHLSSSVAPAYPKSRLIHFPNPYISIATSNLSTVVNYVGWQLLMSPDARTVPIRKGQWCGLILQLIESSSSISSRALLNPRFKT